MKTTEFFQNLLLNYVQFVDSDSAFMRLVAINACKLTKKQLRDILNEYSNQAHSCVGDKDMLVNLLIADAEDIITMSHASKSSNRDKNWIGGYELSAQQIVRCDVATAREVVEVMRSFSNNRCLDAIDRKTFDLWAKHAYNKVMEERRNAPIVKEYTHEGITLGMVKQSPCIIICDNKRDGYSLTLHYGINPENKVTGWISDRQEYIANQHL